MLLVHTEIRATMLDKHIHFFEAAFIQQHRDTFAGSVLSFCVLFLNRFFPAAQTCLCAQFNKLLYFFKLIAHGIRY